MFRRLFISIVMVELMSCSVPYLHGYGDQGLSREDFAHYVEGVFQYQNRVTSDVMMLLEESEDDRVLVTVLAAEQSMHEACAPLDHFVALTIDGVNPGWMLQRQVEKTATECEKAAHEVEAKIKVLPVD